ncbi:MAG: SsrA-binding protein SmpB [Actinomycetota bacterium]
MGRDSGPGDRPVATNRRARFDYEILEDLQAGIVLTGPEVKSLRAGQCSLSEAYARVRDGEVWLENMHIARYEQAKPGEIDERRPRKLLLHRREIERLIGKTAEKGLTLIPMRVYFSHGIAKCQLGLGKGKKRHEKRQAIAERESKREIEREIGRRR